MTVLICAFPHCEEIELLATVDVLRRAGAKVTIFGEQKLIECGQKCVVQVDTTQEPDHLCDCLVIPGGPGWKAMEQSHVIHSIAQKYKKAKKLVCAICAAPAVLARWDVYSNLKICGYPGCESDKATFVDERVVVGDWYVTARGPGVSMEFAIAIANKLGLDGNSVKQGTLMQ